MQINDSERIGVFFAVGVYTKLTLLHEDMIGVQVRQADAEAMNPPDKARQVRQKFFLPMGVDRQPALFEKFRQAHAGQLFGQKERPPFDAEDADFTEAGRAIGLNAVREQIIGAVPFEPALAARPMPVIEGEEHVFEVRVKKPFQKERPALPAVFEGACQDTAFCIFVDLRPFERIEKILKAAKSLFFEECPPRI